MPQPPSPGSPALPIETPAREWPLLLVLAGTQFVHILDFVIIMPLGPQFMRDLAISPQQFGLLVSIYTFSAALWGFAGVFFIDRFDRKSALLLLSAGFALGTLVCGLAPGFETLLLGRAIAGAFGGLMGAVVFSIIGDTFPENRRGSATGTVMSAFSVASVAGVPLGLWAARVSWRLPFLGLAGAGAALLIAAALALPALRAHLNGARPRSMGEDLRFMLCTRNHWRAYGMIVSLMFAAFSVIPFMATYLVRNVGLAESELPYVYLIGGAFALGTSRLIGRLSDRYGKHFMFALLAALSVLPILLLTRLPRLSLAPVILATTVFTVLISGRAIPAMSLITSSVEGVRRGSFMSFTGAVQQTASGFASLAGGMILAEGPGGELLGYDWVGYLAVVATLASIAIGRRLKIVGG